MSLHLSVKLLILIIFMSRLSSIPAELFTALSDMEELFETEGVLISNLERYIKLQEERLEFVRNKIANLKRVNKTKDSTNYILNPVNAYLLTKRLTIDLMEIENVLSYNISNDFITNITQIRNIHKFPTDEDLNGAAVGLTRLQDTYDLDTQEIARGELNGVKCRSNMTVSDCYEVGRQSYYNHDYYHTILWMEEALRKFQYELNSTISKVDILNHLAFCTYKQGDTNLANKLNNEILELMPDHEMAQNNKLFYETELEKQDKVENDQMTSMNNDHTSNDLNDKKVYEMVCRGEITQHPKELAKLKCRYVDNISPFLKIAPLKLEELNLKPYIVLYHQVMYDNEIEVIKTMAKPKFERASVQNFATGQSEFVPYRISKAAFLVQKEHQVLETVGRRLEDMTGLSLQTAEQYQVVNYGIGGHYEPHHDFSRKGEVNAGWEHFGNRIATVLFYMTDVAQGGATAFPLLNLAIKPQKGSAAFWFNLFADGEGDYLTKHAACPVLMGNKWIATRWFHEVGQEFLRPCHMMPDSPDEDHLKY